MKKIFILFFAAFIFYAQTAFASVCNNIKQFNLSNGQTVIVKEIKDNPIVVIDTFIKTGSANENDKNNGVAHFLEHLFFKGTTNHKRGEFERLIESRGGVFNAATSRDYTHYYIKIDSKYFDEALALHSDMLLNIAIPQNELDMERKVVMEEITRSMDNPDNKLFDNFMNIVFNGTSYQRKILGRNDVIKNISREEIFAFHNAWYKPHNMVTVIVGDVDANAILPKITKSFSNAKPALPNITKVPPKENPAPVKIKNRTIVEHADIDTAYLLLGYPSVGRNNLKEAYALDMASSIFAGGQNSILYKVLKQDENLILDAGAGNYELKDRGVFFVNAVFKPENFDKVLAKIQAELASFKQNQIEEKKLAIVKNAIKRHFEYSNESIANVADTLGYDVAVGNGISDYTNYLSVVDSITPEFVHETLNKYLKEENLAVSVLLPKQKTSSNEGIKYVSVLKKLSPRLISCFKNIEKYKLPNGAILISQKNDNNNVIAVKIFIKGGSLVEKKDGTAEILANSIMKGTKNKSGKELEDELDNIGSTISVSNDFEYFEISLKTTKNDFNDAFSLLKNIIEQPAFEDKVINQVKNDALAEIKASRDNPQNIAFENFYEGFYANSPFLKTGKVLEKSIPNISRLDVVSLHEEVFDPRNMVISVVGNFDEKDLLNKFSSLSVSKNYKQIDNDKIKASLPEQKANFLKTESRNSKGAWLVQGWKTKGLSTKDFITLKLISTYLGAGFTSKLFVNLREEKGLAYEVGASSSSSFNQGLFFMYIGTNPENIDIVKQDFAKEIEDLKTNPIPEEELSAVKSLLIGRLKLATETNMSKAHINGYYEFFDKGYRFSYDYPRMIQEITPQDILAVSNKYFSQPYIMSIVAEDKYLK